MVGGELQSAAGLVQWLGRGCRCRQERGRVAGVLLEVKTLISSRQRALMQRKALGDCQELRGQALYLVKDTALQEGLRPS